MHRPIRSQTDSLGDAESLRTQKVNDGEDMARQEFKDESDINVLIRKFGVSSFAPRPELSLRPDTDYDLDLQSALHAVADAKAAWFGMPADVRKAYPTWQSLLVGLDSGEIVLRPESERPVVSSSAASASAATS